MTRSDLNQCFMESPLGRLRLVASDEGLCGVFFAEHRRVPSFEAQLVSRHPILDAAQRELGEYFSGARTSFEAPLAPLGGTAFQRLVWSALRRIPWGETWSYTQLAQSIGNPSAVRAVGAANGKNPLSIFVPCHRVVGGNGALTGYAGGVDNKRWLLAHEAARQPTHASSRVRLDDRTAAL